jgi:hypothetical protein
VEQLLRNVSEWLQVDHVAQAASQRDCEVMCDHLQRWTKATSISDECKQTHTSRVSRLHSLEPA